MRRGVATGRLGCYDSDRHGLAQRYLTQALSHTRHADDLALSAEVLAAQAHQALYLARPDEAIDLARAAQAAAVRHGSATLLTECLVMEAHGHAARDDAYACGIALAKAERTFDRATREDASPPTAPSTSPQARPAKPTTSNPGSQPSGKSAHDYRK